MKIDKLLELLKVKFKTVLITVGQKPALEDNPGVYIYCLNEVVKYIGDSKNLRSRIMAETRGEFNFGTTRVSDAKNLASTNIRLNARFHNLEKPVGKIQLYYYCLKPNQSEKILNCKLLSKEKENKVHIKFGEQNIAVIDKNKLAMISPKSRLELKLHAESAMSFERVLLMLHILKSDSLPPWNLTF